jgi:hypothetical protein
MRKKWSVWEKFMFTCKERKTNFQWLLSATMTSDTYKGKIIIFRACRARKILIYIYIYNLMCPSLSCVYITKAWEQSELILYYGYCVPSAFETMVDNRYLCLFLNVDSGAYICFQIACQKEMFICLKHCLLSSWVLFSWQSPIDLN